jgi:hypothetical protein
MITLAIQYVFRVCTAHVAAHDVNGTSLIGNSQHDKERSDAFAKRMGCNGCTHACSTGSDSKYQALEELLAELTTAAK